MDPSRDHVLIDARLVTMDGPSGYATLDDGAVAWRDGRIVFAGPAGALPDAVRRGALIESAGGALVTPGLIDCHTHLVFAGDRAFEFALRLDGATYEQIARAGGGVVSTVGRTRDTGEEALFEQSVARARDLVRDGATTLEIKSGYGLDLATERKMLRVARRVGETLGVTVRTTFMGAHAVPPEFRGRDDDYIEAVRAMLPILAGEGLVDAVDAFCEGIAFSPEQVARVFGAARAAGVPVKLHADQLSDLGGALLAARYSALSADHLEYTNDAGIRAMAAAGTVAVMLPGAFYALRETRLPPIAALRAHGVPMAVATDLNPGTSPLRSLRLAMGMACTLFRMTPEEALRGVTQHAAVALGLQDRKGRLAPGMDADLVVWDAHAPEALSYWIGGGLARRVFAGGHERTP